MIKIADERRDEDAVGAREAYSELALRYEEMYDYNSLRIRLLF